MRGHPGQPEAFEEPSGESATGKGHHVKSLQRILKAGLYPQVGRDVSRVYELILPAGNTMSQ